MLEFVLRGFANLSFVPARPVRALLTCDEEIGSPGSRPLIEDLARGASRVLVLESPLKDGSLKTERKGVGSFVVNVDGRAAHAGVEPEKGISAVAELAHQVLRLHRLSDPTRGVSVNVGLMAGGSARNVVAASAHAEVDVRAPAVDVARQLEAEILGLQPVIPGATVRVSGRFSRPPMERTAAGQALFERARALGAELGLVLRQAATGGASDGNFTAALGIPTLDGLGARGDGLHADHEHVIIDSLAERAALLGLLLLDD